MSRYDYGDPGMDATYCDGLSDLRPNAHCEDCDAPFFTAFAATARKCDDCWDARDAHTSALEEAYFLKRMAKAILSVDLTKVKEVA
jgi:hypothetical protein